jgi:hypothetical protein
MATGLVISEDENVPVGCVLRTKRRRVRRALLTTDHWSLITIY